jgi:hypothetical protein
MSGRRALLAVAALLAAGFFAGAARLFTLRFESGDIYPPYSSLRADPLGAMALYESLAALPGASAARHMKPLESAPAGGVVFYTGVAPWTLRFATGKQLERFEAVLKKGTRLVLVFTPQAREEKIPAGKADIETRWGVRLAQSAEAESDEEGETGLPRDTLLYFDNLDPAWRALRETDGRAAAILRPFAGGSLALVANGYTLSNEALLEERDSGLIAALIDGPARRFVFDEYHFGVRETGSVAALGRKYGLHGLAAGLLLLAVLFLWKSSSSFLPPREFAEAAAEGRSAASGLVNMLRRGVAPAALPALCVAEWRKSLALGTCCPREKVARIEAAAAAAGPDPLGDYSAISRILAERDIG